MLPSGLRIIFTEFIPVDSEASWEPNHNWPPVSFEPIYKLALFCVWEFKEEETDVDAQIAAALKAEKKVEAEENSALTANVLSEDSLPSHIDTDKFKKYKDKVASINEKNIWKTERDGVARFSFTSTLKANGFDTKNYVRFEDSKPVEFNISGDSYGNAYEKIYSTKHAENNTQDFSLKLYTSI